MRSQIATHFSWPVAPEGHDWVRAYPVRDDWSLGARSFLVLVRKSYRVSSEEFWTNEANSFPLDTATGLFYELARLEPTQDAIKDFADRYGPLTRGSLFVPVDLDADLPKRPLQYSHRELWKDTTSHAGRNALQMAQEWEEKGAVFGEKFSDWESKIEKMQLQLDLWEAIRSGDQARLRRKVRLEDHPGYRRASLITADGRTAVSWDFDKSASPPKTLRDAARYILTFMVHQDLSGQLSVDVRMIDFQSPLRLVVCPQSLQDAISLQFMMAFSEDKNYRNCEVCGKPFELSPAVARKHRTLCSAACKAKAHRQRRTRALALAGRKLSVKQIAKEVGSKESTVRAWLEQPN